MIKNFLSKEFIDACIDYKYLLDRGYYWESALNFVVSRYRLSKEQRSIMLRTIFSEREIESRLNKKIELEDLKGIRLAIDGFNVLATVSTALLNLPLFLSLDSFIRDVTSLFKRIVKEYIIYTALYILILYLSRIEIKNEVIFLYDAQVSGSGNIALYTRILMKKFDINGRAHVVKRADKAAMLFRGYVVASSDSVIIKLSERVVDLASLIINDLLAPVEVFDMKSILEAGPRYC